MAVDSRFGKLAGKPPQQQATSTPHVHVTIRSNDTPRHTDARTRRRAVARTHSGFDPLPPTSLARC
jgi:hypothetical protein